jgi:hypothetical protein
MSIESVKKIPICMVGFSNCSDFIKSRRFQKKKYNHRRDRRSGCFKKIGFAIPQLVLGMIAILYMLVLKFLP